MKPSSSGWLLALILGLRWGRADGIWLATAFAHLDGWNLLAPHILKSKARVILITGLDFCQTEPKLLREWEKLSRKHHDGPKFSAYVSNRTTTFHPKVLLVSLTAGTAFAIVGSGNLSVGGLRTNAECSLYTERDSDIDALKAWFGHILNDVHTLSSIDINAYEPHYTKAHKAAQIVEEHGFLVQAAFRDRAEAVQEAKEYFSTLQFKNTYEGRKTGAARIQRALNMPSFNISRSGWIEFFRVPELGRLRQAYQNSLLKKLPEIGRMFRYLLSDPLKTEGRIAGVLTGKRHIHGVGINVISKVLAVCNRHRWPVFNKPVAVTLRHFGYAASRGKTRTDKYLEFADAMKGFMSDSGAPDVLALDAFFRHWYEQKKARKRKTLAPSARGRRYLAGFGRESK
jgi:hypothetical protein